MLWIKLDGSSAVEIVNEQDVFQVHLDARGTNSRSPPDSGRLLGHHHPTKHGQDTAPVAQSVRQNVSKHLSGI